MSTATYSIELWDHDIDGIESDSPLDPSPRSGFSGQLAREHLDGPNEGLTFTELVGALRRLRSQWCDECISVTREERAVEAQRSLFT